MPSHYRLSRGDFMRMRGFKRLNGTLFSLSFGSIPDRETPGGACVISSKTAPRAHDRNRIKRRCRAILLPILEKARSPMVLVWHAKKAAVTADIKEIEAEMKSLLQKTTLLG